MPQIKCPNCGQFIDLDETNYAKVAEQVRTAEFSSEVSQRVSEIRSDDKEKYKAALQLKVQQIKNESDKEIAELQNTVKALQTQLDSLSHEHKLELDKAITEERSEGEKRLDEFKETVSKKDTEIASLKEKLEASSREHELIIDKVKSDERTAAQEELSKVRDELTAKNNKIKLMELEIKNKDQEKKYEISEAVKAVEVERDTQKADYEAKLRMANEQVEYYKDMKAKMSTKMIGESLEQHCSNEFNSIRMTAFPRAYFEKDNKVSEDSGSKGDFIFRDYDEDGTEIVSIMFEMKNEADTTKTKHKNEDFFKELDKDRREKGCEYAVLVSLLEADNELYNQGIVDVSYHYEKMYVIRPQFFIPMISILRNSAMNAVGYKRQLSQYKAQNIDIENFEGNLDNFKKLFEKHYHNATERFNDAIKAIDDSIRHLQEVKDNLLLSSDHLRKANNKIDEITIKRLTANSPSIAQKFDELKKD